MDKPELLTYQRLAVQAFRQAVAKAIRDEKKAAKQVEAAAVKARDDAQAHTRQARGWLDEARRALSEGREALERANLTHLLEKKMATPSLGPGANTRDELERSVATASRAATGIEQSVQALQQWQEAHAQRRKQVVTIAVLAVLACIVAAIVGFNQLTLAQRYAHAVAALEAYQWEAARQEFTAMGDYRDASTMVSEASYREAMQAMEAEEWERAREALQRIPSYRDADTLLRLSYYRSAVQALEAGEWDRARVELEALTSLDVEYQDVQTLLRESYYRPAVAAFEAGQWDTARAELQELFKLDSDYKDAQVLFQEACYYQAIRTLLETGDWEKAKAELTPVTRDAESVLRELVAEQVTNEASAKGWSTYRVEQGDYMNRLVQELGISKERLISANVKYYPAIRDGSLSRRWLLLIPRE